LLCLYFFSSCSTGGNTFVKKASGALAFLTKVLPPVEPSRFVKQKLLFCAYQTPELDHQISWWWFCCMAYWLLYHVRHIGHGSTRPWHKKRDSTKSASSGEVKRLFATRIFPALGSPTPPPIKREKSRGRQLGTRFPKRQRKKVVKKCKMQQKTA